MRKCIHALMFLFPMYFHEFMHLSFFSEFHKIYRDKKRKCMNFRAWFLLGPSMQRLAYTSCVRVCIKFVFPMNRRLWEELVSSHKGLIFTWTGCYYNWSFLLLLFISGLNLVLYFQGYEGSLIKLTSKQVRISDLHINDHVHSKFGLAFFRNVTRARHSFFISIKILFCCCCCSKIKGEIA